MSASKTAIGQAQTNESKVRLIAFFVLLSVILYWVTGIILAPIFLIIDFGFRSFDLGKYSPLSLLSGWLVQTFKFPLKPVYLPPKRFAARIGLVFSIAILAFHVLGISTIIISSILAFFAALESLFGFCAGCYVYNFLQQFKK